MAIFHHDRRESDTALHCTAWCSTGLPYTTNIYILNYTTLPYPTVQCSALHYSTLYLGSPGVAAGL